MDALDVIVTLTCRKQFERTYKSFIDYVKYFGEFRFIVHIDIIEKNKKEYLPNLLKFLKEKNITDIHINKEPKGHANAINYLFNRIKSEFYFHLEDDWIFIREIDLNPLIVLLKNHNYIDHIRFNKERIRKKEWLYHLSPYPNPKIFKTVRQYKIDNIDIVKTNVWSFNPSIARTSVIKNFKSIPLNVNPEQYICHQYPNISKHLESYIYGKIGNAHIVNDTGRDHPLFQKIKSILRNPYYHIINYINYIKE